MLKEVTLTLGAISAIAALIGKRGASSENGTLESELKDKKFKHIVNTKGSMTKLQKDFYVEPTIVVTESATDSEVFDKVASIVTDVFTAWYAQSYKIMTELHGADSSISFKLLSSNNNAAKLGQIGSDLAGKALSKGFDKLSRMDAYDHEDLVHEVNEDGTIEKDYIQHYLSDELKFEAGYDDVDDDSNKDKKSKRREKAALHGIKYGKDDGVIGTALLRKQLEMVINITGADGKKVPVTIPVTISAKILKVSLDSILLELKPNKTLDNWRMGWLDYRSGVKSLSDLFIHSQSIKEYKAARFNNKDGLTKMLNEKRLSALGNLVMDGAVGYQKYYNMLIISTDDLPAINDAMGGDIYNRKTKDAFLEALSSLSCAVLDDDATRMVMLTSDIDDTSSTSYKSLSKNNKSSGDDMTELLKAIFASRSLF